MRNIISHRGNLSGRNPERENHPTYIKEALDKGFGVELDLWFVNHKLSLGHDKPEYEINIHFLYNEHFWIHAKNIAAAYLLTDHHMLNWFFHDQDDCVLTSKGYLWTYPGKQLTPKSIAVMPERVNGPYDTSGCAGICTDFPSKYLLK